jgi:pimeloyl-ACP methyl ester carboxylesterase
VSPVVDLPDLPGVEHVDVNAAGLRMHVALAGPPDAPPVVLLHGWPQHWWAWRHVIPLLADRYRLVIPDLRGHGWTDAPRSGYGKEQFATDLLATLDALGLDRVRLVGHDWGGWAGFLACLREPARFERFVAVSIPPPSLRLHPRAALDAWRLSYQVLLATPLGPRLLRERPELVRRALRAGAQHPEATTEEDLDLFAQVLQEPARARASSLVYRTFLVEDAPSLLIGRYRDAELAVPTTILYGTHDVVVQRWMLRGGPGFRPRLDIRSTDDAGHWLPEERPDLVAAAVAEPVPVPG